MLTSPARAYSQAHHKLTAGCVRYLSDGLVTPILEALSAGGVPTLVYTGSLVPDDVRQRHPEMIALSKPVLPTRLIGELRKAIRAFDAPSFHG
jgi:hypothetical protein